jgi:hypothetical protein
MSILTPPKFIYTKAYCTCVCVFVSLHPIPTLAYSFVTSIADLYVCGTWSITLAEEHNLKAVADSEMRK